MIHLLILATALLHLQDPAGDAVGDGSLSPPTAPVYANTSDFDLESVTVTDDPKLTVRVTMGSLSNPGHLPNGFSNPVIEVYLDTASGGARALLPGSAMRMPPKRGWNVALRVTGDQAYAVTPQKDGDPGSWPHLPVSLEVQGTTLVIRTDLPRPQHATVYALTGVYDPFSNDAWRPLSTSVSPWAFSSTSQQVPVVDLLAGSQIAQRHALDSGVLIPYRSPTHGVGWLLLMLLGMVVAAAGAVLRRRVRRPAAGGPIAALPPPRDDGRSGRQLPSHWGDMPPTEPSFLDELEEATLWPDADTSVDRALAESEAAGPAASARPAPDGGEAVTAEGTDERQAGRAAGGGLAPEPPPPEEDAR